MTRSEPSPVVPLLYRVEEAAEAMRLSRSALYELILSGQLRTVTGAFTATAREHRDHRTTHPVDDH